MPGGEEEHEGHDHSEEGHSHAYDPHVWLSPERAITLVENIRDSLVAKYPEKKDAFETNAAAYIEKLDALDAKYSEHYLLRNRNTLLHSILHLHIWLWTMV